MTTPADGLWRTARVGVLAAAVAGLALVSHALAGGQGPSPRVLAGATGLAVFPLWWLTARQAGFAVSAGVLGAAQVVFHGLAQVWLAHPGHPDPGHDPAGHAGWLMVLAHLVATVVAAACVAHGDKVLWWLFSWLARRCPVLRLPVAGVPEAAWRAWRSRVVPPLPPGAGGAARRGPPTGLAVR